MLEWEFSCFIWLQHTILLLLLCTASHFIKKKLLSSFFSSMDLWNFAMTEIYCCKFCSLHAHTWRKVKSVEWVHPVIYDVLNCTISNSICYFFALSLIHLREFLYWKYFCIKLLPFYLAFQWHRNRFLTGSF